MNAGTNQCPAPGDCQNRHSCSGPGARTWRSRTACANCQCRPLSKRVRACPAETPPQAPHRSQRCAGPLPGRCGRRSPAAGGTTPCPPRGCPPNKTGPRWSGPVPAPGRHRESSIPGEGKTGIFLVFSFSRGWPLWAARYYLEVDIISQRTPSLAARTMTVQRAEPDLGTNNSQNPRPESVASY